MTVSHVPVDVYVTLTETSGVHSSFRSISKRTFVLYLKLGRIFGSLYRFLRSRLGVAPQAVHVTANWLRKIQILSVNVIHWPTRIKFPKLF
jgi:hypothetical protein